jgi:hypothetical protein
MRSRATVRRRQLNGRLRTQVRFRDAAAWSRLPLPLAGGLIAPRAAFASGSET